jgi:enoyl-CoA hydratase
MTIHYEQRGHVALVTIDRPERRGAMNNESYSQLAAAWRTAATTKSVRVAVITGVGDSYCAGADLKELIPEVASAARARLAKDDSAGSAEVPHSDGGIFDGVPDGTLAVLRGVVFPKPIVAAVNGPCVASGMEMLLGIDIRLASPDAVFGLPEVRRGLLARGGSTVRLPRQIPLAAAMDILLTGRYITAQEAERIGLINRVVEKPHLLDEAMAIADMIAANSPIAVSATKMSVLDGFKSDLDRAYDIENSYGEMVFASDDAVEGPRAFLEKRSPEWSDA